MAPSTSIGCPEALTNVNVFVPAPVLNTAPELSDNLVKFGGKFVAVCDKFTSLCVPFNNAPFNSNCKMAVPLITELKVRGTALSAPTCTVLGLIIRVLLAVIRGPDAPVAPLLRMIQ
ncbi:TPA: hypothetical protein QCU37_005545 [Bacillus cereus]|nr:hypothetical protein [Bacillus cereus]